MGRDQVLRAGPRLQGAPRLDAPDLRCRGRCHRPDRGESKAAGCGARLNPEADSGAWLGPETRSEIRGYFCDAATGVATPPVGTRASAVLVDLAGCSGSTPNLAWVFGASSAIAGAEMSTCGSTSATRSVVTRLVSLSSPASSWCKSSQGGTLSASDSRSPAPPMSNVYLASRPMSRSTIIRSCAL